jgi:hypothetical protein
MKSLRVEKAESAEDMSDMVGKVVNSLSEISPSSNPEGNIYGQLINGPIHWFSDWATSNVPRSGAVVYTIWDRKDSFIPSSMSVCQAGASQEEPRATGRLALGGGSTVTQVEDEVAISSASMSLIGLYSRPFTIVSRR